MKRKTLTEEEIINWWLTKYHGITVDELREKEPELIKTSAWFKKYAVTQKQHDEWREWLIKKLMWRFGISRKDIEKSMWMICFDTEPAVKE